MRREKTRVFVVDDHPVVRDGIRGHLDHTADLVVCGEAADETQALKGIAATKPNVVIMDIRLGDADGLELTRTLASRFPKIRILVLSVCSESEHGYDALLAGASGFLCKERASSEILEALRAIATGRLYFTGAAQQAVLDGVSGRRGAADSVRDVLSPRERQVMSLVARGYETAQIAKRLFVAGTTIETHYRRIRSKLGLKSIRELRRVAVRDSSPHA